MVYKTNIIKNLVKRGQTITTKYGPSIITDANTYGIQVRSIGGLQKYQGLSWSDVVNRLKKGQIKIPELEGLVGKVSKIKNQSIKFI